MSTRVIGESVRTTIEQQRAESAWKASEKCDKEYVNAAKGMPALIMNSGLMQVLAYCEDKGGAPRRVAEQLRAWLACRFPKAFSGGSGFEPVMKTLMAASPQDYQAITTEAFAWLRWLRQLAAAQAKAAPNQNGGH